MSAACPICGCADARRMFARPPEHDPSGRVFTIVRCHDCGVERLDPLPTEAELDDAYGAAYYAGHSPDEGIAGRLRRIAWSSEIRRLTPYLRPGREVLEVGCGTGELLASIRRRHGCVVTGVERSSSAIEATRSKGIPVHAGTLEDAAFEDGRFDVILMRHVVEHVPSPRDLLTAAGRLLSDRGVLLITIPVTEGWDYRIFGELWDGYEVPVHIYHFPPRAIDRLLADTGFVVRSRSHSLVPNPFIIGARRRMERRGHARLARRTTIANPVALTLAMPLGVAAGLARRSGRLTLIAAPRRA
jgi:SAM-dependent methyltransferase